VLLVPGLVILHFLLHVGFSVGRGAPDLLTLALLLAARETRMGTAAGLGLFLGLLEDSFSALAFGANALALTLVGGIGSVTRDLFVGDSAFFVLAYLGIGKLVKDLVFWFAAGPAVTEPFVEGVLVHGTLGALYVAVIGTLLLRLMGGTRELV
jgi:rod shape-determining protein MreD